jgi:hypothetical protein
LSLFPILLILNNSRSRSTFITKCGVSLLQYVDVRYLWLTWSLGE